MEVGKRWPCSAQGYAGFKGGPAPRKATQGLKGPCSAQGYVGFKEALLRTRLAGFKGGRREGADELR